MRPDQVGSPTLAELRARAEAVLRDGYDVWRHSQELLARAEAVKRQAHATLDAWPVVHGRDNPRRPH
jgi:hypothetical protein